MLEPKIKFGVAIFTALNILDLLTTWIAIINGRHELFKAFNLLGLDHFWFMMVLGKLFLIWFSIFIAIPVLKLKNNFVSYFFFIILVVINIYYLLGVTSNIISILTIQ